MKTYTLLLFTLLTITVSSCKNDEENTPPIKQLPEATQEGRGIFGCLVNGEPFIETGTFFNTFYQQVDGEFFFAIGGEKDDFIIRQIILASQNAQIAEAEIYQLSSLEDGNHYGECSFQGVGVSGDTGDTMVGELEITKLDFDNSVVSGTFWFDVIHPETNVRYEIREGRFDTLFTQ